MTNPNEPAPVGGTEPTKLDGTITRLPAAVVQTEIESAQEAARKAAHEARKVRRAEKRSEFKEKLSGLGRHRTSA